MGEYPDRSIFWVGSNFQDQYLKFVKKLLLPESGSGVEYRMETSTNTTTRKDQISFIGYGISNTYNFAQPIL
jgi:hypothetical protein